MPSALIISAVLLYTGLLFLIAFRGEARKSGEIVGGSLGGDTIAGVVYGLTIAVYCTSWTFYGAVGTAVARGWEFLPIYLGPALVFAFGRGFLQRLIEKGRAINTTSIADFLSAHYEKSRGLAVCVTIIAVVGALPYIALQLNSVATTYDYLLGGPASDGIVGVGRLVAVALVLGVFAIVFGAREVDATRRNHGLSAAIAFDSLVKLIAFVSVALFAVFLTVGEGGGAPRVFSPEDAAAFAEATSIDRFLTLTLLSMAAIICLPRQFHVTVVESPGPGALKTASAVFLAYLLVFSVFVLPVASKGAELFGGVDTGPSADLFMLALPAVHGAPLLAVLAFVGGFAAATGMVIVASVALSTMVTNDLVAPFLLSSGGRDQKSDAPLIAERLLFVRRVTILAIVLFAALAAHFAPRGAQLASLGILSFAAAAQFAPALIGALYWRGARLPGAYAGILLGAFLWAELLFAPTYFSGAAGFAGAAERLFSLIGMGGVDALTRGVVISLGANALAFILVSRMASPRDLETPQPSNSQQRGLATNAGVFYRLVERCLGTQQAKQALTGFESSRGRTVDPDRPVDGALIDFADRQIAKAIGASSASILIRGALAGGRLEIDDVAALIDETTEKVSFSQELLQTTLENIAAAVSVVDADLRLVAWNHAYVAMYNYPQGFIYEGRPIDEIIRFNAARGECGPGDIDEQVSRRVAFLRAGDSHNHERTRPNGMVVKIEGVRSPSGAYVTTYTDVSEYKRIEKALSDRERSIRFYMDNVPAMIAFTDVDERIEFANDAYRRTLAPARENVVGETLQSVLGDEAYDERRPHILEALAGRRAMFDIDLPADDGSGAIQHMQVTYVPQFRRNGDVLGFFGLYQDVTARRRAEAALARTNETLEERVQERTEELSRLNVAFDGARREAEAATASKTRFLAAASHDVLQPLNAARLFASAIQEDADAGAGAVELAQKIDASIMSADQLLRALLNISKLDAGGVTPEISTFALQNVFDDLANDFAVTAESKGLRFHAARTALTVRTDRGLLLSALQNIVSNAVRYAQEGGVVIGARRSGDNVVIEVYDTGPGIPEEKRDEIFVEFNQLRGVDSGGGVGLGLATVKRISTLLNLNVDFRSTLGRGSVFSLTAPRVHGAAPIAPKRRGAASTKFAGARVLCIDNDPAVLEGMTAILTRWGAEPITARSAEEALEQTGNVDSVPDLVLIDFQLDNGRTGVEALAALEARWGRRPPAIMITASSSGEGFAAAAAIDVPALAKPVEPAELRALMSSMLSVAAE
ncbi:MAG: PAS-domain containing protein [Pseudomonadota bacterium]